VAVQRFRLRATDLVERVIEGVALDPAFGVVARLAVPDKVDPHAEPSACCKDIMGRITDARRIYPEPGKSGRGRQSSSSRGRHLRAPA
jgi:hypothetical protein